MIFKKIIFFLPCLITTSIYALPTTETSASSTASATLEKTIEIETTPMNFHKILIGPKDSGHVILSSEDSSLKSDNREWIFAEGPGAQRGTTGTLKLKGSPNSTVGIILTSDTLNSGTDSINLSEIESKDLDNNNYIRLNEKGEATLQTGGKLHIKTGQEKGHYSGSYNVIITY